MNNSLLQLKVKQRANKLDSSDYDNLHCWQIQEAFNKATLQWCRRQIQGTNLKKIGDDQSKTRLQDLSPLLKTIPLQLNKKKGYYETTNFPSDFFDYKRMEAYAIKEEEGKCCEPRSLFVYLVGESDISIILSDELKGPSYEWAETVATIFNGTFRIYTNEKFDLENATLVYYKLPTHVVFKDCTNVYDNTLSTVDVESEFKDDVVEILIDETVKILTGDIESAQTKRSENEVETNT